MIWRQLRRGIENMLDRSAADRDVADEVAHYLEELTRANMLRGMPEAEARRAARLALGGEAQVREQVRGYGWEQVVRSLGADVRYAWRGLLGTPGFTVVAAATLAVGIGGATTIFTAAHPILFRTLPYPDAERIRVIVETYPDGSRGDATFGMYRGLADGVRSFDALSVHRPWQPTLLGGDHPERLAGQRVSAAYLRVLGVSPARGRDFDDLDDRAGAPGVAIISDALWRLRFGGDAAVVGRSIVLDDDVYTVIGVMPVGFENLPAPQADVWTPLGYDITDGRAWGRHLGMLGRLRADARSDAAVGELNTVGQRVVHEQRPPTYDEGVSWSAPSLRAEVARGIRPALLAIMGAVGLVLLVACVNVTNLLLARGVRRRHEFALRAALGAGRGRLVRLLLTESFLLATIGGVVGVLVAIPGVRGLAALGPADLPRIDAMSLDSAALLFAFGVTTAAGLALGIVPALQAARGEPRDVRSGTDRAIGGGHRRLRASLVVAQVALALVLLAGSGLLLRSMQRLFAESPGFDADRVVTVQVQASRLRFPDEGALVRYFEHVLAAVRRVPGVGEAALTSQLPLSGDHDTYGVHLEAAPAQRPDEDRSAFRYAVSPGFMAAMGIPLREGRLLEDGDRGGAARVALISESLARQRFAGRDPIGERIRIGPLDGPPYTVVGVVGDVKQVSLAGGAPHAVYTTPGQWRFEDNVMSIVFRGEGDVAALLPAIRAAIWSVDGDQPIVRDAVMRDLVAASAAERRFALVLFELFALAALVLAAAGIYGLLAGHVAERTREIGLRSAVGAPRARIVALVLGQGLRLTLVGIMLGLAGAVAASRWIESLLYGVSPVDALTYLAVTTVLAAVALAACAAPAWRATTIDPAITLRS